MHESTKRLAQAILLGLEEAPPDEVFALMRSVFTRMVIDMARARGDDMSKPIVVAGAVGSVTVTPDSVH